MDLVGLLEILLKNVFQYIKMINYEIPQFIRFSALFYLHNTNKGELYLFDSQYATHHALYIINIKDVLIIKP